MNKIIIILIFVLLNFISMKTFANEKVFIKDLYNHWVSQKKVTSEDISSIKSNKSEKTDLIFNILNGTKLTYVDLTGPLYLKILSISEFEKFKLHPEDHMFDYNKFWKIQVNEPIFHLIGNKNFDFLVYEFYIKFNEIPKTNISLSIDTIQGPDTIFFDGKIIGSTGEPGKKEKFYYDKTRIYPIAEKYFQIGKNHKTTIVSSPSNITIPGNIKTNFFRISNYEKEMKELSISEKVSVIFNELNQTTEKISDSADKQALEGGSQINNFVEIINDITDQINLLSLNASIEAARAGDHGRGFAVVADKISKLATAISDNSKEISSQINIILHDINSGMNYVDITKKSTDTIFLLLDKINSNIDSVENFIEDQSTTFDVVIDQIEVIHKLANEIAITTRDEKNVVSQSSSAVDRLSKNAKEIASSSKSILSLTENILEKSQDLQRLIKQ